MGILIHGMKMPKDCPMCPLSHWDRFDNFLGCEITPGKRLAMIKDKEYADSNTRPAWCPLVEVPTPHGKLIDKEKLVVHMSKVHKEWREHYELHQSVVPTVDDLIMVACFPAVIDAEDGE